MILGGVGLCAGILIDLSINARLKKLANAQSRGDKDDPKLTKNQVVKILREIAVADFPILIDLSQYGYVCVMCVCACALCVLVCAYSCVSVFVWTQNCESGTKGS